MEYSPYRSLAKKDFNKVRTREMFTSIFSRLTSEPDEMLSLQEVKSLVKPDSESYKGVRAVPVDLIVGSEGRYLDFNRSFLPRHQHLRSRWENVDVAHYQQVNLPPVRLYEVGGVFFVRDGNHRVSVARMQGVEFIDAEVISLRSRIRLQPGMGREDLKRAVIELEKREFFKSTRLNTLRPQADIEFTHTGRYDEIIRHIHGHKYYMNLGRKEEISFEEGMLSWFDRVYEPVYLIILSEKILDFFPGRTPGDLYAWIVRHWDELKRKYSSSYPLREAVLDYAKEYGTGSATLLRIMRLGADLLRSLWARFRRRRPTG